jgi:hypothetical protein
MTSFFRLLISFPMLRSLILVSLAFLLSADPVISQESSPPGIYPISVQGTDYRGGGISWLIDRADTSQYLLFGEQHGVAGIAELVTYLYRQLNDKGYQYLALETDPWTVSRCAELGVYTFTRKNPHAIAFDADGDLQLMQSAIDLNPDLDSPVWGLDQMQTAIHPFQRLTEIAENPRQKRIARGGYLKAVLKMGRYTRQEYQRDLDVIEQVFAENPSGEKDTILRELSQTMDIFTAWMDPATRQESVIAREALMKRNFDAYLKAARGGKVAIKMGGAHTMYGIGPNGVETLGEHVRQVAEKQRQSTLSVSLRRFNPGTSVVENADFGEHNILLLDTGKALEDIQDEQVSGEFSGFDAIVYFKDAGFASKSINRTNEEDFKMRFIRSLLPLGVGVLLLLSMLMAMLFSFLFRKKSIRKHVVVGGLAALPLLLVIVFQVLQILKYPAYAAQIHDSAMPVILFTGFGFVSIVLLYRAIRGLGPNSGSFFFKYCHLIFAAGYALTSYQLYYWNIGGMLG